ncbi:dehydrogenase/reductase SDR family member 4 [Chironomus tepperi]|uniref:dehydrogenase/reductase SDR family member 4 n=1 Tax=Chironomus tepperi TaxID=113505 RepID=UPI00391EE4C0
MFRRSLSTMSKNIGRRLDGKVCVITASTEGIGFAIAQRLGIEGGKIVVSSRKQKSVDNAVEALKSQGVKDVIGTSCHVGNSEDRKRLFKTAIEAFGRIDCLVSNAAVNPEVGSVTETSEKAWDKIFDVNVKAAYLLSKEVKPFLQESKGGSIIFVSSIGGYQPFDLLGAYSVSKTALFGLTKALALEVVNDNIRVNCVAPGVIETKFSSALYESETAKETTIQMIPMKRLGKVDEIAGVVAFLASDDASYMTGETIAAAGGMLSRL